MHCDSLSNDSESILSLVFNQMCDDAKFALRTWFSTGKRTWFSTDKNGHGFMVLKYEETLLFLDLIINASEG